MAETDIAGVLHLQKLDAYQQRSSSSPWPPTSVNDGPKTRELVRHEGSGPIHVSGPVDVSVHVSGLVDVPALAITFGLLMAVIVGSRSADA